MDIIYSINGFTSWSKLEACLLPVENTQQASTTKKVATYALQAFAFFPFLILTAVSYPLSAAIVRVFPSKKKDTPLVDFAKHPKWQDDTIQKPPIDIGFANADFQVNGPKEHPKTNWGKHYSDHAKEIKDLGKYPDMWNHPERVIDRLNDLGVKSFRFSISRDKVEPKPGKFSTTNIQHYVKFCRELQKNGIEPMITLDHFSTPDYFDWKKKTI